MNTTTLWPPTPTLEDKATTTMVIMTNMGDIVMNMGDITTNMGDITEHTIAHSTNQGYGRPRMRARQRTEYTGKRADKNRREMFARVITVWMT